MTGKTQTYPVTIDLNQFKLHLALNRINLTLYFNSPSRRFYLSVIALVVNEMKRQGRITSILLETHHDLLALLNDTVGGSAGSSKGENLLSRIYKKWQYALPNLEEAPLFTVVGRKKGYEEGTSKAYRCTEAEKDTWANLFEYQGSHENVRLKFAIDKIGVALNDILIMYDDYVNGEAWQRFTSSLKETKADPHHPFSEAPEVAPPLPEKRKIVLPGRYSWVAIVAGILVVLGAIPFAIWITHGILDRGAVASREKMAFPLPDKPSIAVLPFVNLSGDPTQELFCDGLTDDLITALSKVPHLFVISSSSTFTYKGKPVKVQQVAEDLGIRYVLEGSIQKSGNRVRITAQLIDALKGNHVWSERYEAEMKEFFALQDRIALETLKALDVKLIFGEQARIFGKNTDNLDAYIKLMQYRQVVKQFNKESIVQTRQLAEEMIRLDPRWEVGYHILALVNQYDVWLGMSKSPKESLMKAIELDQKALSLDDSDPMVQAHLGYLYVQIREHEKGIAACERAIEIGPNSAEAYAFYAQVLNFSGRAEEAVAFIEKAFRLNPFPNLRYYVYAINTYGLVGRREDAIKMCKECIALWPNNILCHLSLATNYAALARDEEAHAAAQDVLRIDPKFSAQRFAKLLPYKDPALTARALELYRKAGLPD